MTRFEQENFPFRGGNFLNAEPSAYYAAVQPEKIAIQDVTTGLRFSYGQLDGLVSRVSAFLNGALEVSNGARVAYLGRNCVEEVAIFLACQRVGAIFAPLNWRLGSAELDRILQDCTPSALFYTEEFRAAIPPDLSEKCRAVGYSGIQEFAALLGDHAPPESCAILPQAPVAILYSSGTTGAPKGIVISRQGALFAALNFGFVGNVRRNSVLMTDTPLFHTVALFAVTRTALTYGATLVITGAFDAERTVECLGGKGLGVTHYFGVPQIAAAITQVEGWAGLRAGALKAVFVGGAPLPQNLLNRFLELGLPLVNGFGMSETGTAIHMPVEVAAIRATPDSVGYPAPFVEARIVCTNGDVARDGKVGELQLRGPAITPGYWKNEALTAASFDREWLKTGDLATRDVEGRFRIVDRLKDMYISGGENVYPAEVEFLIGQSADVAEVAVVGVADSRWGERGVAFVVPKEGIAVTHSDIMESCRGLARFKWPAETHVLASLPRTASGKVMKKTLREMFLASQTNEFSSSHQAESL
jgi:fatty-acyl-CoA synthase